VAQEKKGNVIVVVRKWRQASIFFRTTKAAGCMREGIGGVDGAVK
jgi:hypothetical protein